MVGLVCLCWNGFPLSQTSTCLGVPDKPVDLELGELAQELGIGGGKAEETLLEATKDRQIFQNLTNKTFIT